MSSLSINQRQSLDTRVILLSSTGVVMPSCECMCVRVWCMWWCVTVCVRVWCVCGVCVHVCECMCVCVCVCMCMCICIGAPVHVSTYSKT